MQSRTTQLDRSVVTVMWFLLHTLLCPLPLQSAWMALASYILCLKLLSAKFLHS